MTAAPPELPLAPDYPDPAWWASLGSSRAASLQRARAVVKLVWWAGFRENIARAMTAGSIQGPEEPYWRRATRIILGESRGNPYAQPPVDPEKGLWQWHPNWWHEGSHPPVPVPVQWDPWLSSLAARETVSTYYNSEAQGWGAWWGPTGFHTDNPDGTDWDGIITEAAGNGPVPSIAGWDPTSGWPPEYQDALAGDYGRRVLAGEGLFPGPGAHAPSQTAPHLTPAPSSAASSSSSSGSGLALAGGALFVLWMLSRRKR